MLQGEEGSWGTDSSGRMGEEELVLVGRSAEHEEYDGVTCSLPHPSSYPSEIDSNSNNKHE